MKEEPTVLAARINARQAIIVALITAATTLLATWLVRVGMDSERFGRASADSPRVNQEELSNAKATAQELKTSNARLSYELDDVTKALRSANAKVAAMSNGGSPDVRQLSLEAKALRNENETLRSTLAQSRDDSANEINNLRSSQETLRSENAKLRAQVDAADAAALSPPALEHQKHKLAMAGCISTAQRVMMAVGAQDVRRDGEMITGRSKNSLLVIQCEDRDVLLAAVSKSRPFRHLDTAGLLLEFAKHSSND